MFDTIVSADWLQHHLDDLQVTIVDCRFSLTEPELGRQQYETGHIPGAYYLDLNRDLSSPVARHGGRHPLPDLEDLAAKLSDMGITNSTQVIVYDDSRLAFAARLWWLLRYLGHDRVAVLDGGFQKWRAVGYPISQVQPDRKSGHFIPQPRSQWIVDIDAVKARKDLPNVALVDSREGERYRGEKEPIDPIAGHIPGAANYPWQDVTDANGFVRSAKEQRDRWSTLQSADEILVYCGSGVTACVNLLSLAIAGIDTGKLYAGSWSDWCSYS
ncbi:sulfurtransferase [Phormidesmis priestleyi ULC007]|uniref:Sulfurtransferase n=1 Tax=Phormidesmis priestleyi ULC007 TaxID=1920490 RepID=A0A2T1DI57_9CYAN|nr:sulfurtransferase [Phormidesmis priestleyi]PSB20111.1 sulfurtransferase [Phormidesmis priestleyi ULC007]PZO48975.1 MAG: sulfurtransferase [Phormidesmis priestleyi]